MVLVLDLYDIVKQIRSQSKIQTKLEFRDPKWEHPCDVALKNYQVCDHQEKVTRDMQFRINATLMTSDLEVKKVTKIEESEKAAADGAESIQSVQSTKTAKSNVFSVSSHFKNAERNSVKQTSIIQKDQTSDEPLQSTQNPKEVFKRCRFPCQETDYSQKDVKNDYATPKISEPLRPSRNSIAVYESEKPKSAIIEQPGEESS